MGISGSQSSTSAQYLSADNSLSNSLATTLTTNIQGQGSLAGEAALSRVDAAVAQKQAANSAGTSTPTSSAGSGYSTVQNLMTSLDNITINKSGTAPALPSGANPLMNVDQVIATPKFDIKA